MSGRPAVVVVENHRLVAEALASALHAAGIDIAGVTSTGAGWESVIDEGRPDVVVIGTGAPRDDGADLATLIRERWPSLPMIMLSRHGDDAVVLRAIRAGCSGFVTTDRPVQELVAAVVAVRAGESRLPVALLAGALHESRTSRHEPSYGLTRRELEVLELVGEGLTNATIAGRLDVSHNTVRSHVQRVLTKLAVHSKLEAVVVATRAGVIGNRPVEQKTI